MVGLNELDERSIACGQRYIVYLRLRRASSAALRRA